MAADQEPVEQFVATLHAAEPKPEKVVLLTGDPSGVPFVRHHRWVPEFLADKTVVLLNITPAMRPYVETAKRTSIEQLSPQLIVVRASFGYMEHLSLASIVRSCEKHRLDLNDERTAFLYNVPAIVPKSPGGMRKWQRGLFMWLTRVSRPLTDDLEIPPDRRVGLGTEVAV
jgi:K+ transporter